jgi:large subunit ribosomal protein L4
MPKVKLFQLDGKESTIEISKEISDGKINHDLLYRAVQSYLINQRQGTRAVKSRGQVAGSGKKPWPQKHTGRARHGSFQSPIWTGGGITHGPQPADFEFNLPKKMKKHALLSAIRARFQEERVTFIDKLEFEKPKTKEAMALLERLGLPHEEKILVLVSKSENELQVRKSFSNLPRVNLALAISVSPYEIIYHDRLLVTSGALEELTARLN